MSHMIPLAHPDLLAAPGVLDVVFGPDGDFERAPPWAGPLTGLADPSRRGWLVWRGALHVSVATHDGHWSSEVEQWRKRWALDLRVPSVAARLAGLCAKAVTAEPGFVIGACVGQHRSGLWQLLWRDEHGHGKDACWQADGKRCHPFDPDLNGTPFESSEHFLAALTLALAPRIAALRSTP